MLYSQNGDRIVATDSVTSLNRVYRPMTLLRRGRDVAGGQLSHEDAATVRVREGNIAAISFLLSTIS